MDITIIGAGGSVGSAIAQRVVAERLMSCDERLYLVGHAGGQSERSLHGLAVDLSDAYAEICPVVEVSSQDDGPVEGDLIIMAGGATLTPERQSQGISRDELAATNLPVFERYARRIVRHGSGHEIVICISNPNELAVATFAEHLGRQRVVGMGAFLDSLRFRKEIAHDLGIRRQRIHGFIVGEHGANMVPLWSNLHIHGYSPADLARAVAHMRRGHQTSALFEDIGAARGKLVELIETHRIRDAYDYVNLYPPDIRAALKPFVTHFSGSKTVHGTAQATMEMIQVMTLGHDALISGQITIAGEFHGIHGTIGVPCVIGNQGVERVIELEISSEERQLLEQSAARVAAKIARATDKAAH